MTQNDVELEGMPPWIRSATQQDIRTALSGRRYEWLVTGAAGFVGSNLVEALLLLDQDVRGVDNFATGFQRNLDEVKMRVGSHRWARFAFTEMDIRDVRACETAVEGVDYVLHQAALGSVPRSLNDPITSHDVNVTGFLNMLDASRRAEVTRFVYAASSSTYGDEENLPKREDRIGNPLSPYAATKLVDEIYAAVYARSYGLSSVGLRYFNVFGPRQDPDGAYAAVIPKWVAAMIADADVVIHGDGETSRDFCYVANVVQANLRAALRQDGLASDVYNVAVGDRTTLNQLFNIIRDGLREQSIDYDFEPRYGLFRAGDVRHSQADIAKAQTMLGYRPTHDLRAGMAEALPWYLALFSRWNGDEGKNTVSG